MLDGALLGVPAARWHPKSPSRTARAEIYDPPETRDQMSRMRPDPKKEKILKVYKVPPKDGR